MLTLYDYPRSSACCRVRIALNLKQIAYTKVNIDLIGDGGEQHHEDYISVNPQGLVPTLVDDGVYISQSMAIMEYLEEKYTAQALLPSSIKDRAYVRQIAHLISSDIHPLNNLRVLQYLERCESYSDKTKTAWYHHWLKQGFDAIEALLDKRGVSGKYCYQDALTLADICLVPQVYNAKRYKFPLLQYPRLSAINDRCLLQDAFIQAMPDL